MASGLSRRWMRPSSTSEPAVSASAASSARLASASAALPSVQTPTSTTRSSRSWRYSTSETSASSVDRPATRRSAVRSSRASSPGLGVSLTGKSGKVMSNQRWCTLKVLRASELTLLRTPPFLGYLAAGHQYRRAAQVAAGVGDGDGDLAAGDADLERAGRRALVCQRGDGGRDGSRCRTTGSRRHRARAPASTPTPPAGAVITSTLTPSGNCAVSNCTGAATSRAASSAAVRVGVDARQMRIADVDREPGEPASADDRRARCRAGWSCPSRR